MYLFKEISLTDQKILPKKSKCLPNLLFHFGCACRLGLTGFIFIMLYNRHRLPRFLLFLADANQQFSDTRLRIYTVFLETILSFFTQFLSFSISTICLFLLFKFNSVDSFLRFFEGEMLKNGSCSEILTKKIFGS